MVQITVGCPFATYDGQNAASAAHPIQYCWRLELHISEAAGGATGMVQTLSSCIFDSAGAYT